MPKVSGKIKILHVTIGLDLGGVEVFLSHLLPRIDRERYDVTVCSLKKAGLVGDRLRSRGIPVISLEGNHKYDFNILIKLFRLIRTGGYDIVQSHLFLANLACAFSVFLQKIFFSKKVPVLVVSLHELGLWQNRGHRLLDKLISGISGKIICCSEGVKRELFHRLPNIDQQKCLVIYNGISLGDLKNESDEYKNNPRLKPREHEEMESWFINGEFIIGSIGRLDESVKGFRFLIRAIHQLKERINCKLLIIGNGPDKEILMRLVEELQLTSDVKFVEERKPAHLFRYMDLFVLPSLSEGFGLVLLEAMAANVPVVATRVGGIPEVVLDGITGTLVAPGDSMALADAILVAKEQPDKTAEMVLRGRRRVEEVFPVERSVADTEKFYDLLMSKRK